MSELFSHMTSDLKVTQHKQSITLTVKHSLTVSVVGCVRCWGCFAFSRPG